jgi:predicted transcriptional regulator
MRRRQHSEWDWPKNSAFRLLRLSDKNRLGPLGQRILSVLWQRGSATVHEVIKYGDIQREYCTVMTTLDRLYKKGLLDRTMESDSRAFRYVPRFEWQREFVVETVKHVLSMGTSAPLRLSYLVEAVGEYDVALLDELRRLVDERRGK